MSLYSRHQWQDLRARQLRMHPLCLFCLKQGYTVAANVVDHIRPHRGDPALFHDPDNLQSLCKQHHDGAKQEQEKSGTLRGSDANGYPLDVDKHPWFREGQAGDE